VNARLDRPALSQWCLQRLGSEPEQVLFEAGYLSQVIGLRLTDGRDIVVKVRAWQERLIGCRQVQHSLSVGGFPAPRLLVPPERLGRLGVSAVALIHGGALLAAEWDWRPMARRDRYGRAEESAALGFAAALRAAPSYRPGGSCGNADHARHAVALLSAIAEGEARVGRGNAAGDTDA
jgi:hypothetical protein